MPHAQDKKGSLGAFLPSYEAHSIGRFRELTAAAFESFIDPTDANSLLHAIDRDPDANEYSLVHILAAPDAWFSFGHLSKASQHTSCHYIAKVNVKFSGSVLDQASVTLYLYNMQFIVSERGFRPAIVNNDCHYTIQGTDETVGLRLVLTETPEGTEDETALYNEMMDRISTDLPKPSGGDWEAIAPGALRSRIDIITTWKRKGQNFPLDDTGAIATVRAEAIGGDRLALAFWSPKTAARFTGVLHESDRFGLCPTNVRGFLTKATLILGDHGTIGDTRSLTKAKQEFGLGSDFRGLVFGGLGAHWLDDGLMGADITSSASSAAVSFHEFPIGNSPARLYASVSAKINPSNRGSYLSFLTDGAQLKLSVAGTKLRVCSLSATLKDLPKQDNPFGWISGRKVVITLKSVGSGRPNEREDYKLDITIDGVKGGRLKTLTAKELGLDPTLFSYLASVLTLAPVLKLAGGTVQSNSKDKDDRVRFVEIAADDSIGALFATSALEQSWFFKKAVKADELRVTGVRLLSQPTTSGRETALLFDVETDFTVENEDLPLKSAKAMSVRVENTGLLQSEGKVRWVQATQGALELKVLDASAWDFGGLGGLLAVKKIGFQLAELPFLNVTLGLSLNLGIVTADDFKVTVNLKSPSKDIQFYPSKFSIEAGALKGEGSLDLGPPGHALDEVAGFVDMTMFSGIRMAGAVQIIKVEGDEVNDDRAFTAFAAGARTEWPTAVPLGSSGLAIKGFEALYTTHLKRLEIDDVVGIPPALDWLQRAKGDVAIEAVSNKQLWTPDYDHWSFGAGALLVPTAAESLLSFNTMIMLELPGPKILGFIKISFLEAPKGNKEKKDELTNGILGVLEINFITHRLRAGASINFSFAKFLTLYGTMDAEWAEESPTRWHLYTGHFKRPNQIKLTLSDFLTVGATGYLMVAGDRLEAVPCGSSGIRDLPGLAVAMGATAYAKMGSGSLYLRMQMQLFLNVSLGTNIYAAGDLELSGELYIFIGGIGSSGRLGFQYYDDGNDVYLSIYGELCGHIRIGFVKIGGCVAASIGTKVPDRIALPPLINKVSLVSGTNVALFGQGAVSEIDKVIATLEENGAASAVNSIPIDSVVAIALECAPAHDSKSGFLGVLQASADNFLFNYGDKTGGYALADVTLYALDDNGKRTPIDHTHADAVWWRNAQSPGDRHAIPMALALLTRCPFGTPNAVATPDTIERWIDALTDATGICDTLAPQLSINQFSRRWISGEDRVSERQWQLQGRFYSSEVEHELAASPRRTLSVSINQRFGYGLPEDYAPGFPRYLGTIRYEEPPKATESISVLELFNFPHRTELPPTNLVLNCAGMALVPESGGVIMTVLLACRDTNALDIEALCFESNGTDVGVRSSLDRSPDSAYIFHEAAANWRPAVDSFLAIEDVPGYGELQFARLTITLMDEAHWNEEAAPTELCLSLRPKTDNDWPSPIYIAAFKYLSIEEYRRHSTQKVYNDGVIKELEAYLRPRSAPFLEPNSKYQLQLIWRTVGDKVIPRAKTELYAFTTDANPPRLLAPYLLGTYPQPGARFHPPKQQIGFSLSSGDILKILTKFSGAALKITVSEDGNNPVTGNAGEHSIDWVAGRIYLTTDLMNLKDEPIGLIRKPFRALPSTLLRAIKAAMARGKLGCLSKNIPLDDGMWLGIVADLEPLRGYTVTVSLVDGTTGKAWPYSPATNEPEPFFRWNFRTGLHRDLNAHAGAFSRQAKRSRPLQMAAFSTKQALAQALSAVAWSEQVITEYRDSDLAGRAPPAVPDSLSIVDDQALEDLLTLATGARSLLEHEAEILLIWSGTVEQAEVVAIVLKSREPISRRTQSVHLRKETNGLNTAEVLHLEEVTTRYPFLEGCQGVERLFLSSSGTTIVVFPDRAKLDETGRLTVTVKDRPPYYLPYADAEIIENLIEIAATEFAR